MVNFCYKQKSTLVKCLIILLVALIVVLTALFVNLVIRKDNHICNTEQCIKASAEIIRYINQIADPCKDFHEFACGNFIRNGKEPLPSDPREELDSMIMNIEHPNDSKPLIAQKLFYQACMNLVEIDMDEDETLLDIFYSLGRWPVLMGASWNGTFFDWTEVAINSRRFGMKFDWFLNFTVYEDTNDTRTNILKISIPTSLRRISLKEKQLRIKLLTDIAEFLGAPKYLAHYETGKTIDFEDDLGAIAEKHRQRESQRDVTFISKLTISEVQTFLPNIQWLPLINNITEKIMAESDYIIFNIIDYVKDLERLIIGTPKRIVADYMMWIIIEESWQFLSQPIRKKFEKYLEDVYRVRIEQNRQKFCINESKKQFPLVAESTYIQRHVTEQKRLLVREMLFIIQRHYIKLLEKASGMNWETRRESLTKLQNLKFTIAGPEEVFDEFRFAENLGLYGFAFKSRNMIEMLNQRRNRFYGTYFSVINRMVRNNTIRFYEKVINITGFSVVNHNTMVIPAALLRDTFFTPNLPNYLNYGSLGKVLAREIFDYLYSPHDTYEETTGHNWWTKNIFKEPIDCLIKEFNHFHDSEIKRPEKMKEHLADFVASEVAYESYNEWLHILPEESKLPGLNFNPHQLFWIQSSKFLCTRIHSRHHKDHSRFKIIAPLKNSRHFADDFGCFQSSEMTSRRKCRIL